MNIQTKFDIGQIIWTVHRETRIEASLCPFCYEGHLNIMGKDNSIINIDCPKCKGEIIRKENSFYIPVEMQIDMIETLSMKGAGEIRYHTLVRSLYSVSTITEGNALLTKDEAQVKCDELNKMVQEVK